MEESLNLDQYSTFVTAKLSELSRRSETEVWAACAAIWSNVFVLAKPGWQRWPYVHDLIGEVLHICLQSAAGRKEPISPGLMRQFSALGDHDFDGEEEGNASDTLRTVIGLIEMLSPVLDGRDAIACAATALERYLERIDHIVAMNLSQAEGRPISVAEAESGLPRHELWLRAISFVKGL